MGCLVINADTISGYRVCEASVLDANAAPPAPFIHAILHEYHLAGRLADDLDVAHHAGWDEFDQGGVVDGGAGHGRLRERRGAKCILYIFSGALLVSRAFELCC